MRRRLDRTAVLATLLVAAAYGSLLSAQSGAVVLVGGTILTQDASRPLVEKKVAVTTTLALRDAYRDASGGERRVFGTPYGDDTRRMFEQMLKTAATFHAAGVPLVVGTDCCQGSQIGDPRLQPGSRTIHEIELLERAGLPRDAILAAATRVAAEALGLSSSVGTIAAGKFADLIILTTDPRQDLRALHKPVAVIKNGRIEAGALPN